MVGSRNGHSRIGRSRYGQWTVLGMDGSRNRIGRSKIKNFENKQRISGFIYYLYL